MSKNVICWFEIYVKDINRAKKFYSDVLGRTFQDAEMGEGMKMSFFHTDGDIDAENYPVTGALVEMIGAKEGDGKSLNTLVYFPCEDCSVEESRVEKAGGFVQDSKMSIGEYGFCSICVDSEGNLFGLHSMK